MERPNTKMLRQEARRRLASESLKRCPLCDSLNSASNGECFACGWHGKFENDPDLVEEALDSLLARCPSLAEALATEDYDSRRPWYVRVTRWFRKRLGSIVDIRA